MTDNNEHSAVTSGAGDEPLRQDVAHSQDATADLRDSPADLSIPQFLRRPVTPESIAAVAEIVERDRLRHRREPMTATERAKRLLSDAEATERRVIEEADRRWRTWLPTEENHNVRPTIAAFRKQVREEFAAKRERRLRVVSAAEPEIPKLIRGVRMTKPGAKEKALQASREAATEAAPPAAGEATATEAVAETKEKESPVRTKTNKKASKANARKAVSNGKADVRPGSKLEIIVGLLKRKNGCTTAEVLKATGWPAVSMPQQAKAAGLKLRKVKDKGEPTRYFAA